MEKIKPNNEQVKEKEQAIYERHKREFKSAYPAVFEALEIAGVHPDKDPNTTINPYFQYYNVDADETTKKVKDDFRNIGEHCIWVGICAKKIADKLMEADFIDHSQRTKIIERALIHDANKGFEVMRRNFANLVKSGVIKIHEQLPLTYSPESYETMSQMIINSIDDKKDAREISELIKISGKETGHNSLKDFVIINDNGAVVLNPERNIEEIVVHLSDDMTTSPLTDGELTRAGVKDKNVAIKHTIFVNVSDRMLHGHFPRRYDFLYNEGFGFDNNGKMIELKKDFYDTEKRKQLNNLKSYAEWQIEVANMIFQYLKNQIDRDNKSPMKADQFIVDIVNN